MAYFTHRTNPDPFLLAAAGVGLAAAGVGLALWQRRRKADKPAFPTDAPHWTKERKSDRALFGKSMLVNSPREELFAAWVVKRFPEFMEHVVEVDEAGDGSVERRVGKAWGSTCRTGGAPRPYTHK